MNVSHELLAEIREVFIKLEQGKTIHADALRDLANRIREQLNETATREEESITLRKFREGRFASLHDEVKAMREIEEVYRE